MVSQFFANLFLLNDKHFSKYFLALKIENLLSNGGNLNTSNPSNNLSSTDQDNIKIENSSASNFNPALIQQQFYQQLHSLQSNPNFYQFNYHNPQHFFHQ